MPTDSNSVVAPFPLRDPFGGSLSTRWSGAGVGGGEMNATFFAAAALSAAAEDADAPAAPAPAPVTPSPADLRALGRPGLATEGSSEFRLGMSAVRVTVLKFKRSSMDAVREAGLAAARADEAELAAATEGA